ncbi:MAG TPA: aldehyde dehydrogenase family protein, partial [Sphingobium sp.]|nr:aldehyde dehydrogenase family protein [Sphingobium sp.]
LLSFTGSPDVGWDLKARSGKKKVVLELGGNAAVIIDHDADLDDALERVIFGAFYQSGQSCIGVQRIIIHESVYDKFRDMLVARIKTLIAGDPKDRNTFIGPMISESEARRLDSWIQEAVASGATLLCGGRRDGAMLEATLLENVDCSTAAYREEAFGPLALISKFSDFEAALEEVNDSKFGLQAGIFTRDLFKMFDAWDRLDVGGVVINDVPSYRVDNMPYGGVKDSGLGREGIRFAMEDMTEIRNLVIRRR